MRQRLKGLVEKIPFPIGSMLARVPFSLRFGRTYGQAAELAAVNSNPEDVVSRFSDIFEYSKSRFPFYS